MDHHLFYSLDTPNHGSVTARPNVPKHVYVGAEDAHVACMAPVMDVSGPLYVYPKGIVKRRELRRGRPRRLSTLYIRKNASVYRWHSMTSRLRDQAFAANGGERLLR